MPSFRCVYPLLPIPSTLIQTTLRILTNSRPIDTIKVRMQLSRRARAPGAPKRGFITTGAEIMKRETPLGLYKGLGAVITGIVPKMAIRFTSFEAYKKWLADKETGVVSGRATFLGMSTSLMISGYIKEHPERHTGASQKNLTEC